MTPAEIERVALLGWRVYPASSRSKAALVSRARDAAARGVPEQDGRAPWEQATADLDQIDRWSAEFPGCNWRVVMGGSGIWALDVDRAGEDHAGDGIAAMAKLVAAHGALPPHPRTRSGGGGLALFFRDDGHEIHGATGYPVAGLDPRNTRQTVTIPPSRHVRSGRGYRWMVPPWELTPPRAPDWLLEAVQPPPPPPPPPPVPAEYASERAQATLTRESARVMGAGSGQGNRALWVAAHVCGGWVAVGQLSEHQVAAELYHAAQARGTSHHREIEQTIRSGLMSGRRRPMEIEQ